MNRLTGFKRVVACMAAVLISAAAFSSAGSGVFRAENANAQSAELKENQQDIDDAKQQIDDLIAKQEELDKKINETKDNISSEEENQKAIEEQIVTVQQTIMALTDSISTTKDEISELEDSIAEKEVQVAEKHEEIVQGVGDFKERLKAMYVAGGNSYSDIIVGASDFYDMLMKVELVKRVAAHDDEMIDDLIVLKNQYEADEAELNSEKSELEIKQADLESKKEAHEKQYTKLQELFDESQVRLDEMGEDNEIFKNNLAIIQQQQEEFEKDLQKLYKEREAIKAEEKRKADEEKARQEEERRKAEEERLRQEEEKRKEEERIRQEEEKKRQEEAARLAAEQQQDTDDQDDGSDTSDNSKAETKSDDSSKTESSTDSSDSDSGIYIPPTAATSDRNAAYGYTDISRFTWPVPGHYNVTYGFGYRNAGVLTGYHGGIDIYDGSIYGSEIIAADDGVVIRVENYCPHDFAKSYGCGCGGNYGRYCIIEHSDGYWTLYGHQSNCIVSVGQTVTKGQVIGYIGSTGHSTGPHLHFEVYEGGVRVDPANYVGGSVTRWP